MAGSGIAYAQSPDVPAASTVPAPLAEPKVTITSVQWEGAPRSVDPLISPALSGLIGRKLTGKQIAAVMADLTDTLHKAGYVLGQAAMMAPDLEALKRTGALRLTIFPGKVGAVRVRSNTSRVNDERLRLTAEKAACPDGMGEDCILTADRIERLQLLVVDVPGVKLQPVNLSADGVQAGQTAVELTAEPSQKMLTANLSADNYGYPVSGQFRFSAGAQLNNLFHMGDIISLVGSVTDKATLTGTAGFTAPIGYDGLRMMANYAHSQFTLPQVNSSGSADTGRIGLSYPLVRGLDSNWTVSLDGGLTQSTQTVMDLEGFPPRYLTEINGSIAGNSGERAIQLGDSYWTAMVVLTQGWVNQDLQGGTDTTGVLGDFQKIKVFGLRKQNLGDSGFYVLADFRGQLPDKNLDAFEKLPFGGQTGVRAYSIDEGSFDAGAIMTLELRRLFKLPSGHVLSPGVVLDGAMGVFNLNPYPNWQTQLGYNNPNLPNFWALGSIGPAFDWTTPQGLAFSISWSTRLPGSPDSINHPGATNQFLASLALRF